jgi:hypothetical protein
MTTDARDLATLELAAKPRAPGARSRRAVWLVLVVATLISYASAVEAGWSDHRIAGVPVLVIAFFKVRLIGLHFMELQTAILPLRLIFECWTVIIGVALVVLFRLGG